MKLTLLIENIEFKNNLDEDDFDFPMIYNTKKMRVLNVISNQLNAKRYLLQAMGNLNQRDSALVIIVVIDRSGNSTAVKIISISNI